MTDEIKEINAAQTDFGDEERIVFQVTKALFEDFFNTAVEPAEDFSSIISAFEEQCYFGITTLRKLLLRSSKNALLSLNLCHLVSEHRAYTLLKKLRQLEDTAQNLQVEDTDTVLDELIASDEEFRRLLVLLEWCEENERNDPKSIKDLDNEIVALGSAPDVSFILQKKIFRVETLHSRKQGKRLCDLASSSKYDLDGAKHGRLHGDDEDLQNKVYRVVYMLLKSGRINEACEVLEKSGLPALVPSLKLRRLSRDSALTSKSKEDQFFGLAESRAIFKKTVDEILFAGDSLSHLESCIWCIVAGRLEPALSLSSRTDERLWCYANAAVECRIDARLAEERGLEKESGNLLSGNDLMVDSIFDEIITKERSPYYSSYRFLLIGDSSAHVDFMKSWLEEHPDSNYPHILRFMVHVLLMYLHENAEFNMESGYWIMERYIELLISMKLYTLVPFYASRLLPERRDHLLVTFMYSLEEEESRLEVLAAAHKAGCDTSLLCKKIFAHAVKVNPVTNESSKSDDRLVNSWTWLTFSGKELIVDALIGANLLLRRFFYLNKLKEAKLLLKQSSENIAVIVGNLWSENFPNQPVPHSLEVQIKEYTAYILYLEAMNYFDNWFKQFAREKPVIPEKPTDETWSRMEIQEKASFELQHKQLSEAKYRHEAATKFLFESAYASLLNILRQPGGWLNCFLDSQKDNSQEERNNELRSIRERFIGTAITLLQTICEQSDEKLKALDVLEAIANEEFNVYDILSKEQLRVYLRKFSLFAAVIHS
ncbi:unnamed protein product [Enterobius vermicularis]|uniref:Nuclear pore complex protein n=1 Tax=Enterobius vermicularis TaxID=51028 RepID=A0A0N4VFD5_ENTVE|nr:unnamed protein product [Enterobius vermicularis]